MKIYRSGRLDLLAVGHWLARTKSLHCSLEEQRSSKRLQYQAYPVESGGSMHSQTAILRWFMTSSAASQVQGVQ